MCFLGVRAKRLLNESESAEFAAGAVVVRNVRESACSSAFLLDLSCSVSTIDVAAAASSFCVTGARFEVI